ncbi:hypothetical protein G7A72_03245 [Flavobacterium sp. Sr18]|uniref:hypothetical protein n=1 Tax=Flavobacterium sp. Sr18 TaxID=935222 RepID=UPI0013E50F85|nr:hypothetical protein [Flavobacterium sp. Sr18]QIH37875.1 hypothetical protein G7A72_03245 [Flavobacterium sp. Sr18]
MIPSAGDEKSGGRVVDSFTLMPSWIRKEISINGTKLKEADYTALHPNIAVKLYAGKESYITHQKVAENASIDVADVKIEHLSFFNKHWNGMLTSPLFNYYANNETEMMENIFKDKQQNGYKITSRKLFKAEVDVMTTVIEKLNGVGIYVLYVYDALICKPEDESIVIEIMDKVILDFGIKTEVKKEAVEPEIDLVAAQAFADAFLNKIKTRTEEKIQEEIDSVNDIDNLFEVLKQSPMKEIHKLSIYDDIKDLKIKTLEALNIRIAS